MKSNKFLGAFSWCRSFCEIEGKVFR